MFASINAAQQCQQRVVWTCLDRCLKEFGHLLCLKESLAYLRCLWMWRGSRPIQPWFQGDPTDLARRHLGFGFATLTCRKNRPYKGTPASDSFTGKINGFRWMLLVGNCERIFFGNLGGKNLLSDKYWTHLGWNGAWRRLLGRSICNEAKQKLHTKCSEPLVAMGVLRHPRCPEQGHPVRSTKPGWPQMISDRWMDGRFVASTVRMPTMLQLKPLPVIACHS